MHNTQTTRIVAETQQEIKDGRSWWSSPPIMRFTILVGARKRSKKEHWTSGSKGMSACRDAGQEGLTTQSQADSAVGEFLPGGSLGLTCDVIWQWASRAAVGQGGGYYVVRWRGRQGRQACRDQTNVPLQRRRIACIRSAWAIFQSWNDGKTGHGPGPRGV